MAAGDVIGTAHRAADRSSSVPARQGGRPCRGGAVRSTSSPGSASGGGRSSRPVAAIERKAGCGQTWRPPTRTSRCRCGVPERPVLPLRPTRCPATSTSPGATSSRDRWQYVHVTSGHDASTTVTPMPHGPAPVLVDVAHHAAAPGDDGRARRHHDVDGRVVVVRRQPVRQRARRPAAGPQRRPRVAGAADRRRRRHRCRRRRRSRAVAAAPTWRAVPSVGTSRARWTSRPSSGVGST